MPTVSEVTYEEKKNLLLKKFADSTPSGDPVIEADAVIDLSIDWACLQRNLDRNDPSIRKSLRAEIKLRMHSFDPNNPELTHSAKLLRLLGGPNPGEMLTYAEDLDRARRKEEGQKQAARARTPRKRDALEDLIISWLKVTPSLCTATIVDRIKERPDCKIIDDVDEKENAIWYIPFPDDDPEKVKKILISGMDARISRIKTRNR